MTLPRADARYAPVLAERWQADAESEGARDFAVPGTTFRHSWAAGCTRAIQYRLRGVVPSNPHTISTYWTFRIGQTVHEAYQAAFIERFPNASIEHKVHIEDCDSSGHIDIYLDSESGRSVAIEVKTINGTGYKVAVGGHRPAEGPRWSAVVQAAVNAYAVNADYAVVVYLPLEALSQRLAYKNAISDEQRVAAEWWMDRDVYVPIAEVEMARWKWLKKITDEGKLAPRFFPDPAIGPGAVITNPRDGSYVNTEGKKGKTWACDYCEFQTYCSGMP